MSISVMKKQPDKNLIAEVALVMALSPAYVEKDWYITQILNLFENLYIKDYTLVFTGGTALSKAHKLIKRVSEDLDFRIIADKKFHSRTSLSNLKNLIVKELEQINLDIRISKVNAKNKNLFFAIEIDYKSHFDQNLSLRPHILIELNIRATQLPPLYCNVTSFITELTKEAPEVSRVACINPIETAADKLSALTWRIPDRVRNNIYDDPNIVRHIHDLAILKPIVINDQNFLSLVSQAMEFDKNRSKVNLAYATQSLENRFNNMLNILKTDKEYSKEYKYFVETMSYDQSNSVPSYDEALKSIEEIIQNI